MVGVPTQGPQHLAGAQHRSTSLGSWDPYFFLEGVWVGVVGKRILGIIIMGIMGFLWRIMGYLWIMMGIMEYLWDIDLS